MSYSRIKSLVNEELKSYFRPEFLNRLDEIIVFRQLTKKEVKQIADIMLRDVFKRGEEKGLKIEVTEKFKDRCAAVCVWGGGGGGCGVWGQGGGRGGAGRAPPPPPPGSGVGHVRASRARVLRVRAYVRKPSDVRSATTYTHAHAHTHARTHSRAAGWWTRASIPRMAPARCAARSCA
jgi:hypothetical protein